MSGTARRTATRVHRRPLFVSVDRRTVRDERISYRALGLLTYLLDHPADWTPRSDHLAAPKGREGRDAVRSTLHELARAGYYRLERRGFRDGTSR